MNYINNGGYSTFRQVALEVILPVMGITSVLAGTTFYLSSLIPFYVPYLILIIGTTVTAAFPFLRFEQRKVGIHEKIHLFITYLGTLSTLKLNRTMLFKKLAEEKEYGELRIVAEKIIGVIFSFYFYETFEIGSK